MKVRRFTADLRLPESVQKATAVRARVQLVRAAPQLQRVRRRELQVTIAAGAGVREGGHGSAPVIRQMVEAPQQALGELPAQPLDLLLAFQDVTAPPRL